MVFATEILTAEFLFTVRLKRRSRFWLRFILIAVAVLGFAALFPTPFDNAWYSSFVFFAIFATTVPALKLCYAEPWKNILFCAIASYTVRHFAFEFSNLVLTLIAWGKSPLFGVYDTGVVTMFAFNKVSAFYSMIYLLCFLATYVAAYYLFCKRIKKDSDMRIRSLWLMLLIGAGLLCNILLHSVIIYKPFDLENITVNCAYNMMTCVLLLCGQFALLQNKGLKTEVDILQQMWHDKQDQYVALKENMEVINMKYHDLRHFVEDMDGKSAAGGDILRELKKSLDLYDTNIDTGNEALDVILSDKSLRAQARGITMSCVADGQALRFLSEADMYSLFGNAIDNAIEAAGKIAEPEKRIVSVNARKEGGFVSICIKNTYEGKLEIGENGLPVTTKENAFFHGYGIKSINYIIDKYDGSLSITLENGTFMLDILLPV